MRPCPPADVAGLPRQTGEEQPAAEAKPQETPELPAETVGDVAPASPTRPRSRPRPIYRHRFRDAKPINFGKRSPRQLAVHGVDVSRWQGEIDWQKLRSQGANFVYIKATDGGDHLDPMFKKNWRDAEQRRPEARRLPLLLLVPHRRRAGRLVHPQRAEGRGRAAAGHRRRVERRVQLQAAPVARQGAGEDAGLHGQARAALRPAPDHLHRPGFLSRQSEGRVPRLPVLAARRGRSTRQRSIPAANGCSGSIPAPASRTA